MKINFLYRRSNSLRSGRLDTAPWVTSDGILNSFKKFDLVHYSHDCVEGASGININELIKYPIFIVRGYDPYFHTTIDNVVGRQFMAWMDTETLTLRSDLPRRTTTWNTYANRFSKKMNMIFTPSKLDQKDYHGKDPNDVIYYRFFVDTDVVKNVCEPIYDELTFIGPTVNRLGLLNQIPNLKTFQTPAVTDLLTTANIYVKAICEHKFLLAPPAVSIRVMSGRPYEIMACERVCFCYVDYAIEQEDDISPLKDGENIVLFKSVEELKEKYAYYKTQPELCAKIGKAARQTVLEHYSCDKWIPFFVEKMYERINKNGQNKEVDNRHCVTAG